MRLSRGASVAELERVYRAEFTRFVRVATAIAGEEQSGADAESSMRPALFDR